VSERGRLAGFAKLIAGGLLLTGAVLLLMQGFAPPGIAGDVIRNNQQRGIDATPLFYTGVESAAVGE
jgi:hypothetical protein